MTAERCGGTTVRGRVCRIWTTHREGDRPMCHHHGGSRQTELWQVSLMTVDPDDRTWVITEQADAETALRALGVEYAGIETDGMDGELDGIWLVGLLGRHRAEARWGEVWEERAGYRLVVEQP